MTREEVEARLGDLLEHESEEVVEDLIRQRGRERYPLMTALKKRWPIPDTIRQQAIDRIGKLLSQDEDDYLALNAMKVLASLEAQNMADDHLEKRLKAGLETPDITVTVNING